MTPGPVALLDVDQPACALVIPRVFADRFGVGVVAEAFYRIGRVKRPQGGARRKLQTPVLRRARERNGLGAFGGGSHDQMAKRSSSRSSASSFSSTVIPSPFWQNAS